MARVAVPSTGCARGDARRTPRPPSRRLAHLAALAVGLGVATARRSGAQETAPPAPADSVATVRVLVLGDSLPGARPLAGAVVRGGRVARTADSAGVAVLRLPAGAHALVTTRIGFRPDTTRLTLRAAQDTAVAVRLAPQAAELEGVVVAATRGERRVEDTPLRVEVIDEEEVAEKVSMTPGDIAMMLNETSGLRVQTTSPSLGGASVRVQGLLGRYALLLADGLPLYGGQGGGLGLLQVPPVDLGRVEVIKGTASALYGSAALGGVVNLVSRRPAEAAERTLVLNQTSRGGTDGVFFGAGRLTGRWGYTMLAGAHRQRRNDLDGDGWTDMPGYRRAVVRPRAYFDDGGGRTAFLTGGVTAEDRDGGTLGGRAVPNGTPGGLAYAEGLRTRRADVGGLARWVLPDGPTAGALHGAILTLRGSAMTQRHAHQFGTVRENDRHRTAFAEAAATVPRAYGDRRVTYVAGVAFQQDAYRAADVAGFDYTYTAPAAFAQLDADPARWLSLSGSARLDAHSAYGTFVNPRVSLLVRRPATGAVLAGWTARLSGGTGAFAPTPFTEETEVTGLSPLAPFGGLVAERARSASFDVGGPVPTPAGRLELNGTLFGSRVRHALQARELAGTTPAGAGRLALVNAPGPTRTWGGELLARLVHALGDAEGAERALRVTATYTYLRGTECDPHGAVAQDAGMPQAMGGACARRETPLNPRHAAGLVASVEQEGRSRVGLELYYTGRQALERNPYRQESQPYLVVGLLAERQVGRARAFVNFENLGNVRQTRVDPLVLPARGEGGRWTTDVWSLLEGRTVNAGVRLGL